MLSRERSKKEFKQVDAGEYPTELITVKDCEVGVFDKQGGAWIKTGTKPGVRLVFKTENGDFITHAFSKSCHKKSAAYTLLQEMYDARLKEVEFVAGPAAKNFAKDEDYFWDLFEELQGKLFKVTVIKNGEYAKVTEIEPLETIKVLDAEECKARRLQRAAGEAVENNEKDSPPDAADKMVAVDPEDDGAEIGNFKVAADGDDTSFNI